MSCVSPKKRSQRAGSVALIGKLGAEIAEQTTPLVLHSDVKMLAASKWAPQTLQRRD